MLTSQSPLALAYLRFLQLAKVVQALPDGQDMDANEEALLQAVVLCCLLYTSDAADE